MHALTSLTPAELGEFLPNVAIVRPVFIGGPPGIGKSSLVEQFAASVGLECVSLLGSQLAPRGPGGRPPDQGRSHPLLPARHDRARGAPLPVPR